MRNKAKILIQVKGVGFTFLLDKRMKHNLISPTFLAFFKTDKQRNSLLNNDIEAIFRLNGSSISWYKFRECKAVKFNFEYEEHPYSELFFVDKSVEENYAILGSTFWSKCDILK